MEDSKISIQNGKEYDPVKIRSFKYIGLEEIESENNDINSLDLTKSNLGSPKNSLDKDKKAWLDNIKDNIEHSIGHINEAPHFIQDNEFLLYGYRINFFTGKKICRSLFMCHNETVNVWSHILISLFCVFLIFNTEYFFNNSVNFLNSEQIWHKSKLNGSNIIQENLPYLYNERIIHDSVIKIFEKNKEVDSNILREMINNIDFKVELNFLDRNIELLLKFEKIEEFLKNLYTLQHQMTRILNLTNSYYKQHPESSNTLITSITNILQTKKHYYSRYIDVINHESLKYLYLYNIVEKGGSIESIIGDYFLNKKEFSLDKWPVYIFLAFAIICFTNSAIFHLFSAYGENVNAFLSRLDYAGIALLISGSCIPPYYYIYYCTFYYRTLFVGFICTCCILVFICTLNPNFNRPLYRKFRGFLFLALGISAASPLIHLFFFFNPNIGMIDDPILIYWIGGGLFYIFGVYIYLSRIPERKCQGKFDYCGASHQIWHLFSILGMLTHYLGCLGSYYDRVLHECPNI